MNISALGEKTITIFSVFALLSRDMEDIFEKTQTELFEMKTTMSELNIIG